MFNAFILLNNEKLTVLVFKSSIKDENLGQCTKYLEHQKLLMRHQLNSNS